MLEYLRNFDPDANIGQVFADLYDMGHTTVGELDAARGDSAMTGVPGTELSLNDIRTWPPDGGYFLTRAVMASSGVPLKLFAETSFYNDGEYVMGTRVEANRGSEIGGDYSIGLPGGERMDAGTVVVELRGRGAPGPIHEPLGLSRKNVETPLSRMSSSVLQRLEIVSQGIIKGISAAEVMRLGASMDEALVVLGRTAVHQN